MDEEEELENTLIGQEEEAPAIDTGNALMGAGQVDLTGQVNFRDYDVPEPSRTAALSVFAPSGDLKPGIDVNAITPAPTTLPTPSVVNTALNQEIPVGLPSVQDSFDQSAVRSGRSRAGEGGQNALRDFLSSFEFQGRRGQRTGDSSVVQTPLTLPPAAQSFFGQAPASNAAEAAQRLIDAGPAFTQGQAPALDPTSDEAILPTQGQATTAPTSGLTTVGGASLSEFLSGQAMPERGFVREERPLSGRGVTLTPEQMNELSAEREARLAARIPGDQTAIDTRAAQSRTTGGQTEGLSFDDARRRAEGQLAARGIRNPSVSQVNALARSIQAAEPERLAELETQRALDAAKLRDEEAKKDFKPQVVEIGGQKLIQLAPNYYQPVRPEPTAEEPFEPRVLEEGGFTYYEVAPNRFERQPKDTASTTEETSGLIAMDDEAPVATKTTPTVPNDIKDYPSVEAAEAANLAVGTRITVQGKPAIIE